ncbi:MAG: hypothetical protein WDN04_12485 [Rhodospirillales bacterium]
MGFVSIAPIDAVWQAAPAGDEIRWFVKHRGALHAAALILPMVLAGCGQLIAGYSLEAYKNDTTLKADVAALVEQSSNSYDSRASDVNALTLKLHEAYEFSKGEASNQLSTREWELLLQPKPDGTLYYAFLDAWHRHGALDSAQMENWKTLLDRAFDYMICLEANKQSSTACPMPEAIPAGH